MIKPPKFRYIPYDEEIDTYVSVEHLREFLESKAFDDDGDGRYESFKAVAVEDVLQWLQPEGSE